MRILFITLNQVDKGTFFRALGFAKEMSTRGHEITLLATSKKNKLRITESIIENQIKLVETPDIFSGPLRSGWDIWNTINRIVWLWNKEFDLVHAFESRPTVILPSLFLKRKKIPLVMDWADWFGKGGSVEERENPIIRFFLRPIETFFEENFRKTADFNTVICTGLRDKLISLGVPYQKILMLRNGVDVRKNIPIDQRKAREKLKMDENIKIIGWLGSTFKKDALLMAKAFDILTKHNDNVYLLIAGYFNHEVKKIFSNSNKVFQTGFISQDLLDYYLSTVDLFWLPLNNTKANQGRFPYKLTQYMTFGKPIVSSPVGDITELFEKEKIGVLVPDEPEEYAFNTLILFANKPSLELMGNSAKRLVESEFSWKVISNYLEDMYISLR